MFMCQGVNDNARLSIEYQRRKEFHQIVSNIFRYSLTVTVYILHLHRAKIDHLIMTERKRKGERKEKKEKVKRHHSTVYMF